MLKKSISLLLVLILMFSLSACGGITGADAQIIYPIDSDPRYLDPQIVYETGARNIIANCFEGLVSIDQEGKIVPAQAESWKVSSDGKTYTFYLRRDLKWRITTSAGSLFGEKYTSLENKSDFVLPVTAHDFAFGITRALLPETVSPDAESLYSIKNAYKVHKGKLPSSKLGVKATDDYTLKIQLNAADPDFLYTLTKACCMPCNEEFFEATGGRYGLAMKYLICNGPFYLYNWADNASVLLRRSDAYYDNASVMPSSVYFSVNNEQDTRLKKLTNETYNVAPLTAQQAQELQGKKKYTVKEFDSSVLSFVFNCSDSALSNLSIRQAIFSAINTSVLTEVLPGESAEGIFADGLTVGEKKYNALRKSIDRYTNPSPITLLKKGLQELEVNTVSISVICSEENETAVRTLMQSWQSILGVSLNITVEPLDALTLQSRISKGNYQLALTPVTFTDSSAFSSLSRFSSYTKENIAFYKNPTFDKMIYNVKNTGTVKDTAKAIRKAEEHLILNCVIYPVYQQKTYCGLGEDVSGVIFNRTGNILYFKNTLAG